MKNILKKLGVLGLIVAMLTPYVYIPEVKAETTTTGCTQHLNTYLFMDNSKIYKDEDGNIWLEALTDDEGSKTWANVPISIPSSTSTSEVTIKSVEKNNLTDEDDLEDFWKLYVDNTKRLSSMNILEKYGETFTEYQDFLQNSNSKYKMNDYESISAIFHGKWSNDYFNGEEQENNYDNRIKNVDDGVELSLQTKFPETIVDEMNIAFENAEFNNRYSNAKYFETPRNAEPLTADYFQDLIDGKMNEYTYDDGNQVYFSTTVYRTVDLSPNEFVEELNTLVYGAATADFKTNGVSIKTEFENSKYLAFYEYIEGASTQELKNSFTGLKNSTYSSFNDTITEDKIDIDIFTSYYWPAVLNVEYEVCPVENVQNPEQPTTTVSPTIKDPITSDKNWSVEYNSNVDDASVTNIPGKQTQKVGTNITVSSEVPTRKDYAFKGWCVGSKKCTNTVESGNQITSPDKEETITLYAQWGETGAAEQEKTGVVSYIIGFAAVGLVAGGVYLISKKKNLFKQI